MMTYEQRVRFVTGYFNTLLSAAQINQPMMLTIRKDNLLDFGTLDGKFFSERNRLQDVCMTILRQLFTGYMTLENFATVTQTYFKDHNITSYFVVVNTKPFGQQRYFEKKYYIAEMETDKDLQIEVTQIGQKKLKVIGFIVSGEKKQEFSSPNELIELYVNLYVQYLCDIL